MSRVALRRPSRADQREFLALMDASRALHHPWAAPWSAEQFAALLERDRGDDFESLLLVSLEHGPDHPIAGYFNLSQIFRGGFQNAYLGYCAGQPYAGRGYMTEGLELVLSHAFATLGLHRLEANIQPGNGPSLALVRRCGFRREGFSPRYLRINGEWRDHERWAITVEDWQLRRMGRGRPAGRAA